MDTTESTSTIRFHNDKEVSAYFWIGSYKKWT